MRRIALTVAATMAALTFASVPAHARHCGPGNATNCPNPLTVIVIEGVGNVCDTAKGILTDAEELAYGNKCTYNPNDPTWVSKPVSPWNQPATKNADGTSCTVANGCKYQGLFWPGVGPPANGPYALNVGTAINAPNNACVSSTGGPGCKNRSVGELFPGASGVGAMCGSSKGSGKTEFTSADLKTYTQGVLAWQQSAATILPLLGEVRYAEVSGFPDTTYAPGAGPVITGFTSSRGLSASGNCGVTQPTTGFQTEGIVVVF